MHLIQLQLVTHYSSEFIKHQYALHASVSSEELIVVLETLNDSPLHYICSYVAGPYTGWGNPLLTVLYILDKLAEIDSVRIRGPVLLY